MGVGQGFPRYQQALPDARDVDMGLSYDWIRHEQAALPADNAVQCNFHYRW